MKLDCRTLHETIKIVRDITGREKQIIIATFSDLDILLNQYRQAVMWLAFGNHAAAPRPTTKATQKLMKDLREKITALLKEIELKTQ